MNYKSEKFTVSDGKKVFTSEKWGIFKASSNLPKIGRVFALPISFLFSAGGDNQEAVQESLSDAIPKALLMFFDTFENENPIELFQIIFQNVYADNGTRLVDVEKDFDDLAEVVELAAKVLKQQYGSLTNPKVFGSLLASLAPLTQASQ